jgi:hypothetical protein
VTAAADKSLSIVGHPAALVCGGPDDSHYNVDTAHSSAGHVLATATIQVFPISTGAPKTIPIGQLPSYLPTDDDTRVYLVTGALTAITELQEQFHP